MTDPFRAVAVRGRIIAAGALAVVAALVVGISYFDFGMPITHGHEVQAEVVRGATRPAARVAGGDLPILTVRLPDGAVRDVQATWADVGAIADMIASVSLRLSGGQFACISICPSRCTDGVSSRAKSELSSSAF
jgi:hypothetical protein